MVLIVYTNTKHLLRQWHQARNWEIISPCPALGTKPVEYLGLVTPSLGGRHSKCLLKMLPKKPPVIAEGQS